MKAIRAAEMRALDARAMHEAKIPGTHLMELAGRAVALAATRMAKDAGLAAPSIQVFAGKGNNGGDAFVAARYLRQLGYYVDVWLAASSMDVCGDAAHHLEAMRRAEVPLHEMPSVADWHRVHESFTSGADLVIDGLLGTGLHGAASGVSELAITYIQRCSAQSMVIAIDVPSGLDADHGVADGVVVPADLTVTMGLPKIGMLTQAARNYVGNVEVAEIGIPKAYLDAVAVSDLELIVAQDLMPLLPIRDRDAHKGTFGHLLIIAGADGYSGAAIMAAKAALRSGVGLVSVLTPRRVSAIVAGAVPEAMVHGAGEYSDQVLGPDALDELDHELGAFDAVLMGPGLTTAEEAQSLTDRVLGHCSCPLIMDADSLNHFERRAMHIRRTTCPVLLTPHPGEMARLLDWRVERVQGNREEALQQCMLSTEASVVLKGAGTLIGERELPLQINLTGNPGMACGGTGDVLAGFLSGFVAQGLSFYDASRLAVYLHGAAGDRAGRRLSQAGMTACDIIDDLPIVLRSIAGR
jgi:NAD(P)H-hydrate epimerase